MNVHRIGAVVLATFGISSCAPSAAASPAATAAPRAATAAVPADGDLSLDADVQIRSIRFDVVPKTARVTVSGVNQTGGSNVVRTNLPSPPQAGKTYTNVRVQLHAASRFVDPRTSPAPSSRPAPH